MQPIRFALLSLLAIAAPAFAHPGHGKPGFNHAHTPLEYLLIDATLIVAGLALIALLGWAALALLRR
jgi:hypothetical protein